VVSYLREQGGNQKAFTATPNFVLGGDFGNRISLPFDTPADFDNDVDDAPVIGEGQLPLTIVIQLDNFPTEIGWRVDRLGIEVEEVIRVPAGIYTTPLEKIVRTVVLDEGELYYFRIYDVVEDGINGGLGEWDSTIGIFDWRAFALMLAHLVRE
jgi:hypothetical protein